MGVQAPMSTAFKPLKKAVIRSGPLIYINGLYSFFTPEGCQGAKEARLEVMWYLEYCTYLVTVGMQHRQPGSLLLS